MKTHQTITSLSGNEIYCLAQKNFAPGNIVMGNSVYSLGILKSLSSGLRTLLGGEVIEFTKPIKEGREAAYQRLLSEVNSNDASGVTGVSSDMTNVEMWNMANLGYEPVKLLLGTSVYSLGFIGSLKATLKSFIRGEINELTTLIYSARKCH